MSEKLSFSASLDDLISEKPSEKEEFIETMVKMAPGLALNIRAVVNKRNSKIEPSCWLHLINDEETESRPLCHFPLVPKNYQAQYHGSNLAWFHRTFKEQWTELEKRMEERLREDASIPAEAGAEADNGSDVPF